ncbi:MAG: nitroreductase family protein [Oscillospiraceae bacterium]|nr:nitroreductase family protein [Oscillospiraceae bacterium]
MDTLKCIETRRSIRQYDDEHIDRKTIEKLIAEAQFAPTWKNSQTSRFTAITDKAVLLGMCKYLPAYNAEIVKKAPLVIAVSAVTKRSGYERDGSPTTPLGEAYTYFDCGTTVQTLCLAANELSIGTVIMGIFDSTGIKPMLSIPDNEELIVLVACGYKDSDSPTPKRRPLDEVLKII